jgi:hypothetical protein
METTMSVSASVLTALPPTSYDDARKLVKTGDLILCSGPAIFSRLIRWATASPWSHIAMVVRMDDIDRVMVMEAVEKIGVRIVPFSRFVGDTSKHNPPTAGQMVLARHAEFESKSAEVPKMIGVASDRLGAEFRPQEITKIGLRIVAGALNRKMPRLLEADDEFICSEYVDQCYRAIGIEIPWDGRGFIAPDDFARADAVSALARLARPGDADYRKPGDTSDVPSIRS